MWHDCNSYPFGNINTINNMDIIKPSVVRLSTPIDMWKNNVCRAARVCYAASSNGDDMALLLRLIKDRHVSPWAIQPIALSAYTYKKLTKITSDKDVKMVLTQVAMSEYALIDRVCMKDVVQPQFKYVITTTLRTVVEEAIKVYPTDPLAVLQLVTAVVDTLYDFIYGEEGLLMHENPFITFEVVSSIGCTRELNRHSSLDFYLVEQSTRFCNFAANKFNHSIKMNEPYWFDNNTMTPETLADVKKSWNKVVATSEKEYLALKDKGIENDIVRGWLTLDLNTKAIYTATKNHWLDVIAKRLEGVTGTPHGDAKIIAGMVCDAIKTV